MGVNKAKSFSQLQDLLELSGTRAPHSHPKGSGNNWGTPFWVMWAGWGWIRPRPYTIGQLQMNKFMPLSRATLFPLVALAPVIIFPQATTPTTATAPPAP